MKVDLLGHHARRDDGVGEVLRDDDDEHRRNSPSIRAGADHRDDAGEQPRVNGPT